MVPGPKRLRYSPLFPQEVDARFYVYVIFLSWGDDLRSQAG